MFLGNKKRTLLSSYKKKSLREKLILSNYDHNCVFSQTPNIKSFFKPTSESIVACEGQSKVKAMEKHETENISPMKTSQHSVELPAPTKPLLEVKILEKDEVPTILSKDSLWQTSGNALSKHVG